MNMNEIHGCLETARVVSENLVSLGLATRWYYNLV
jgi:hypothetical protein